MVGSVMVSWRAMAASLAVATGLVGLPQSAAAAAALAAADEPAGAEVAGSPCTAINTIVPGTPRSGMIQRGDREIFGGVGRADVMCVPVTAGQRVSLRVQSVGVPLITVAGGAGALDVETCEDCATGFVEPDQVGNLTLIARETGNLVLVVGTDQIETGQRYAVLADVSANPAPTIRPLVAGTPVRGTLSSGDWIDPQAEGLEANRLQDVYTLQLRAGRPVEITLEAAAGNTALDPYLVLGRVGPDGRLVDTVTDDDSGPGLGARIRFTPEQSGTYQVRVRALSGEAAGPYTLQLGPVSTPPRPRAAPLTIGQTQTGSIGPRSPRAEDSGGEVSRVADFTLDTIEGDLYTVRVVPTGFDPFVTVGTYQAATGSDLAVTASGGGVSEAGAGPLPTNLIFQATSTGPTIVRVASPAATGSFQLEVNRVAVAPHPVRGLPLAVPGQAVVNLADGGARTSELMLYQVYEVDLTAGQRISIDLTTGGTDDELSDPVVEIGRGTPGSFESLGIDDDGGGYPNARLRFTAPAAGRYLIRARGFSLENAGRANLSVQALPPPPALTVGASLRGELDDGDDRHAEGALYEDYTLALTAGQTVRIEMRRVDDESTLDPLLVVTGLGNANPDAPLAINDDMAPEMGLDAGLVFVAPADGIYLVRAATLGSEQTGAYTLEVQASEPPPPPPPPPPPTPIEPGTPVSGRLETTDPLEMNPSRNFDQYVFEAQAGETYLIDLRSPDPNFDSFVRAGAAGSDPAGWAENDDGGGNLNALLEYQVTVSGPQVIRVSALYEGVTEGDYQLTVTRQ